MFDHTGHSPTVKIGDGLWSTPAERPAHWDALVDAALRLAAPFDYVRVDLYEVDGRIWFSEMTFYPQAGYDHVDWREALQRIARHWDIRRSWFMTTPQRGWRARYQALLARALAAQE